MKTLAELAALRATTTVGCEIKRWTRDYTIDVPKTTHEWEHDRLTRATRLHEGSGIAAVEFAARAGRGRI